MLIRDLYQGDVIVVETPAGEVRVAVVELHGYRRVTLGITAPSCWPIRRAELPMRKRPAKREATG